MRILNYGAGAVGLGLDSCLLKTGHHVDLIARPTTIQALKENGLEREGLFGAWTAPANTFGAYVTSSELPQHPYDFILMSVKSFDSAAAAQDLARHPLLFQQTTKIILCQNGWGNAEIFSAVFPKKMIYNARIITGFERPQPHRIRISVHADAVKIGSLFSTDLEGLTPLCRAIADGGIPCETSPQIEKELWAKMLYNCALNALGAIFEVPYGALGQNTHSRSLMDNIFREIFAVMDTAGYRTHWESAAEYQKVFYEKFLPATAAHSSSTLQDIRAGKQTEIEALNAAIVRLAQAFNLEVPVNQTVWAMVKFKEGQRRPRRLSNQSP